MSTPHTVQTKSRNPSKMNFTGLSRFIVRHRALYIMLIPGMLYFLVFKCWQGALSQFQDYNIFKGFLDSEWVGFKWFEQFFAYPNLIRLLKNTLIISFYQVLLHSRLRSFWRFFLTRYGTAARDQSPLPLCFFREIISSYRLHRDMNLSSAAFIGLRQLLVTHHLLHDRSGTS